MRNAVSWFGRMVLVKRKHVAVLSAILLCAFAPTASAAAGIGKQMRSVSVIQVERPGGGALLFLGTEHAFDPSHPQFADILAAWRQFKAQVVLVEGGQWPSLSNPDEAIRKFGEMGYVTHLASTRRLPLASIEPPFGDEVAFMTQRFDPTTVKLFYALRVVPQWRATGLDVDKAMERLLQEPRFSMRGGWPESSEIRVTELDALLRKQNLNISSWRDVTYEMLDSESKQSSFRDIARASTDYRNQHMARVIVAALRSGKKVFVIAGNSHLRDLQPMLSRQLRDDN